MATSAGVVSRALAGAVVLSLLILTGLDHRLEAALVLLSPAWLTDLTTWF